MAKKKGLSLHSRAARRATSPSIDTDKSLKDITPPSRGSSSSAAARPSVLAAQHAAGIAKKTKRGRKSQMSAKARRRREKGLEMAEAVIERTSKKVEKSLGRGRMVKDRSRRWEDVNKAVDGDLGEMRESEGKGWETDEEMDGAAEDALTIPVPVSAPAAVDVPLPIDDDDGDEIL